MNNKLYLVLYSKISHYTFTKYFDTEFEMDKYKKRVNYMNLILLEDSRDIFFWED